jgi:hypothetical protein
MAKKNKRMHEGGAYRREPANTNKERSTSEVEGK